MRYSEVLGSLRRVGGGWTAEVPEDWMQGRTVFGGLQVAFGVRAMRALLDAPLPLRSLQATFVAPLPGGKLSLVPELLRVGTSATQARCDLLHGDAVACTLVGVFGCARPSSIALEPERPMVAADPESLEDLPYVAGSVPAFVQHMQLRWAEGKRPFSGDDRSRTRIYVRHRDGDSPAEDSLIALADTIPTPALSALREPTPASSLTWALVLLRDPSQLDVGGWSLIDTEVHAGADGYLSQSSFLWGAGGNAFSVSHQTVSIFG